MNPQSVITLGQQGMEVMLMVGAPLLLAALVTGLLVSVFQAATQLNEATLSFLPKLMAVLAAMVVAGPWMIQLLVDYIQRLFASIPSAIG
ncbi:MAG: flagellar biosynthesis protein FliQ [Betaproteobacteria bacterium]|jgi:flagellar biosynthetic protein FliQ|nr:flagellar biosynthesis protein FliQ [Betaproteobacteria bacterium]